MLPYMWGRKLPLNIACSNTDTTSIRLPCLVDVRLIPCRAMSAHFWRVPAEKYENQVEWSVNIHVKIDHE